MLYFTYFKNNNYLHIPNEVRNKLNLNPHECLTIKLEDNCMIISPLKDKIIEKCQEILKEYIPFGTLLSEKFIIENTDNIRDNNNE